MLTFNPNNLALIISFLAGAFFACGGLIWYWKKGEKKDQQESQNLQQQLESSFSLSGYLLEASNEEAVILAAMRSGYDLLGAEGSAFVPFNEWEKTLPVLHHGDLYFLNTPDWEARLSTPETRHVCRNCSKNRSEGSCALLMEPNDAEVYCVSLRWRGRVIGIVSYFFTARPEITKEQERFLAELVRLTDLRLDALRAYSQELASLRQIQESVISQQELASLTEERQNLLAQLEYQAVLNERTRLAREIHDGLAQTLAFLKLETTRMQTYMSKGETAAINQTLQACHKTLSDAYLDARQAIDNLRRAPDELLETWLTTTTVDFGILTGLPVNTTNIHLEHVFPDNIKVQLCRIVQEALTNIRKHAQANAVTVSAFHHDDQAVIEISDDGLGFSPENIQKSEVYGLRTMRERAESINADFQIISTPGQGTVVRLQVPTSDERVVP